MESDQVLLAALLLGIHLPHPDEHANHFPILALDPAAGHARDGGHVHRVDTGPRANLSRHTGDSTPELDQPVVEGVRLDRDFLADARLATLVGSGPTLEVTVLHQGHVVFFRRRQDLDLAVALVGAGQGAIGRVLDDVVGCDEFSLPDMGARSADTRGTEESYWLRAGKTDYHHEANRNQECSDHACI